MQLTFVCLNKHGKNNQICTERVLNHARVVIQYRGHQLVQSEYWKQWIRCWSLWCDFVVIQRV